MLKKRVQWVSLAILIYLIFLIVYLPARHITSRITLPRHIILQDVSGSIWHGQARRASINGIELQSLEWSLNFLPLITRRISADIKAGNIRDTQLVSANGHVSVKGQALDASDLTLYAPVEQLLNQLTLPFPADVGGRLKVELDEMSYDQHCSVLSGNVQWINARVNALNTAVDLESMAAKLSCDTQQIVMDIEQPNLLGLEAKATMDATGKFGINGKFKPADSLPPQVKQAASFFGQPDSAGFFTLIL